MSEVAPCTPDTLLKGDAAEVRTARHAARTVGLAASIIIFRDFVDQRQYARGFPEWIEETDVANRKPRD